MNKIIFAGGIDNYHGDREDKYLRVIVPADLDGKITVVPPYCKSPKERGGKDRHILIEQAILPIKQAYELVDVSNGGIRHAAMQAEEFFKSGWNNRDLVLSALGDLIVGYIGLEAGEQKKISPVTAQVRSELDRHVSDPMFSVDQCLRRLPLNYDYTRKLFKKEVGATPHEYLLRARMELARGLILSGISNQFSGYTVSQIAEASGFSDPLYFSRVFKKYFGVSPSDYKRLQNDGKD